MKDVKKFNILLDFRDDMSWLSKIGPNIRIIGFYSFFSYFNILHILQIANYDKLIDYCIQPCLDCTYLHVKNSNYWALTMCRASTLHILVHLVLTGTLYSSYIYTPFTDEETEA